MQGYVHTESGCHVPHRRWMVINALLAYLTNLLNFLVTKVTSALTLQVRCRALAWHCT